MMRAALPWTVAAFAFVAYAAALQISTSCANQLAPWCAAAFFAAWLWLAWRHDRRGAR